MTSIRGKTAVVIGASSGVGRATVKALIAEEAHVIAIARGGEALDALRSPAHGTTRRADLGILFRAVERRHASGVSFAQGFGHHAAITG